MNGGCLGITRFLKLQQILASKAQSRQASRNTAFSRPLRKPYLDNYRSKSTEIDCAQLNETVTDRLVIGYQVIYYSEYFVVRFL